MAAPTDTRQEGTFDRAGLSGGLLSGIFVALVALGALVAWLVSDEGATAELGEPAPAVALVTFQGDSFDLADHFQRRGGPVLLNLWASWCEPCLREFPVLSRFAAERPDVTVVGVAVQDQQDAARAFARDLAPEFPVGWDADGSIREAYPSFGLPATFAIGPDGVVTDIVLAELTAERLRAIDFGS